MTDLFSEEDRTKFSILIFIYALCMTPFIVSALMDPGNDMSYGELRILSILPVIVATAVYALYKIIIRGGYE